jgi:hypothetical protein
MCESGISVGGFLQKGQDTRISPHITTFSRGLSAKLHISFFFLLTEWTGANRGAAAADPAKLSALRWPRSSGAMRNRKRSSRGLRGTAHRNWRWRDAAGFHLAAEGHGGRLGLQGAATLRWISGNWNRRSMFNLALRCSWRHRLPPVGLHGRRIEDGWRRICGSGGARLGGGAGQAS